MNTSKRRSNPPSPVDSEAMREQIPARVAAAATDILAPLAQLFVAHGLKYGDAESLLKEAFLLAGQQEFLRAGIEPNMSRLSVSTGLHRKDVKRLLGEALAAGGEAPATSPSGTSLASIVYTRWTTDPALLDGPSPRALPLRAGPGEPSFESIARDASTDAHPRSILEELRRLGLVEVDDDRQLVVIKPGGFIPLYERSQLLALLGNNVGDHLASAVGNVLDDGNKRLEQAVFIDALSPAAIDEMAATAREVWADAMRLLVRKMAALERRDEKKAAGQKGPAEPRYRLRVGMYLHSDAPRKSPDDQ